MNSSSIGHRQRNGGVTRSHSTNSTIDTSTLPTITNIRSNHNKRGRRPISSSSSLSTSTRTTPTILYWVVGIGASLCLLECYYLIQYVVPTRTHLVAAAEEKKEQHNRNSLPIPEIVPVQDDDSHRIPGDHEDIDIHNKPAKSLFDHPVHLESLDHLSSLSVTTRQQQQEEEHPAEPQNPHNYENHPNEDDSTDNEEEGNANAITPEVDSSILLNHTLVAGKEPLIALLRDAGVTLDDEIVQRLPTWQQVADLYGDEPVVFGLETCFRFQKENGDPADHFVSTAGTFNTGTNLMAELLIHNCHMPARMAKYGHKNRGVRWQVLWGKHTPVGDEEFRLHHRTYNDTMNAPDIFPAVTVRDPFKWMQSMCRHKYAAHWQHDTSHCPSLVPNEADIAKYSQLQQEESIPVRVRYKEFDKHHTSLVDFWNTWYQEYVQAPFPRLIVRFEDIIFHPVQVTKLACECAGGQLNSGPFRYQVESAKRGAAHGKQKTSYVDSLIKYGSEKGRYDGFTSQDLQFVQTHLDPELMKLFGYKFASN